MGRVILTVLIAFALVAGAAYFLDLIPSVPGPGGPSAAAQPGDAAKIKAMLDKPLYEGKAPAPIKQAPLKKAMDPIVIAGQINVAQQVDVACPVEGRMAFVGEEVPEGTTAVAGVAAFLPEPFQHVSINQGDRQPVRFYRLLKENQVVREGQNLALVDPSRVLQEVVKADAKVGVATAESVAAKQTEAEAQNRFNTAHKLYLSKSLGLEEYNLAKLTWDKSKADALTKTQAVRVAEADKSSAAILLKEHEIVNKIPAQRSIIKKIYKKGLEAAKAGEAILQIYSLDKLEAEAMVDSQFIRRMHAGMNVIIEPQQEESPVRRLAGHMAEVTSVAVTNDSPNPLYVSGSEDKTVRVWDRNYQSAVFTLKHPEAVRVVVCTPPTAKHNLILVGCADGSIHLWNLAERVKAEFQAKPARTNSGAHKDAVTSLAFTPDGKYFATGGADNSIKIWETEGDFKAPLYPFDYEHGVSSPHQGAITSLHFTPQGKLVSAARDNTLRVWTLFKDGAKAHLEPIANRSGNVGQLGVSTDGRWMLFDHGKTLQVLSVETGQTVNVLQNPAGGIPFETLAIASPDASLLLTAGAAEGRLQLWKAPTENARGFEVRQLTTAERSPVTCAAFSPLAGKSKDSSYAVSGAKDGSVYIWPLPSQDEVNQHRIENVKLSRIGQFIDPSSRQVRIGVDLYNDFGPQYPGGARLEPGRAVTIVIEP